MIISVTFHKEQSMHMSDALVSVPTALSFWGITAVTSAYASSKIKQEYHEDKSIPFMGVMGAFVFALQMVNFAIPATGSSGHFAGGFLLAMLLGPNAAFLVMASVLFVQALFFADGGLLALGCNIFNMGFIPAYVIYPLFKALTEKNKFFIWLGGALSLLLGSVMVSMQTVLSGISELPFSKMLMLMVGIHILIGIFEGLITIGAYQLINSYKLQTVNNNNTVKPYFGLGIVTVIIASIFSLFASSKPDGLEWSIYRILGRESEPESVKGIFHEMASVVQNKISILPDYNFGGGESFLGTSIAGITGAVLTLIVAASIGYAVNKMSK
ncbi:energy-coupling factor ABC transporter permease [Deferribacterales bacterium Es71-Z0220]|uniref:energy-coupling factor ABC transporter permease n=1 Tax=Deferrivibrio essentukiensis TaxID=2880922 RepID=UPI001F6048A2|nr:energy-coupling factor ABC transporter permease [Deferrivibrio essentukiensis]